MAATKCDCGTVRKVWLRKFYWCMRCRAYYDFIGGRWHRRIEGMTRAGLAPVKRTPTAIRQVLAENERLQVFKTVDEAAAELNAETIDENTRLSAKVVELEAALAAERQRREAAEVEARKIAAYAEQARYQAGNVLAAIHRDGGHYISEHGWEKACRDAIDVVMADRAWSRASQADAAILRKAAEKLSVVDAGCRRSSIEMPGGLLNAWADLGKALATGAGQPLLDELARKTAALQKMVHNCPMCRGTGMAWNPSSGPSANKLIDCDICLDARAALAAPSLTPEQRAAKQAWIDDDDMPLKGGD